MDSLKVAVDKTVADRLEEEPTEEEQEVKAKEKIANEIDAEEAVPDLDESELAVPDIMHEESYGAQAFTAIGSYHRLVMGARANKSAGNKSRAEEMEKDALANRNLVAYIYNRYPGCKKVVKRLIAEEQEAIAKIRAKKV